MPFSVVLLGPKRKEAVMKGVGSIICALFQFSGPEVRPIEKEAKRMKISLVREDYSLETLFVGENFCQQELTEQLIVGPIREGLGVWRIQS